MSLPHVFTSSTYYFAISPNERLRSLFWGFCKLMSGMYLAVFVLKFHYLACLFHGTGLKQRYHKSDEENAYDVDVSHLL